MRNETEKSREGRRAVCDLLAKSTSSFPLLLETWRERIDVQSIGIGVAHELWRLRRKKKRKRDFDINDRAKTTSKRLHSKEGRNTHLVFIIFEDSQILESDLVSQDTTDSSETFTELHSLLRTISDEFQVGSELAIVLGQPFQEPEGET